MDARHHLEAAGKDGYVFGRPACIRGDVSHRVRDRAKQRRTQKRRFHHRATPEETAAARFWRHFERDEFDIARDGSRCIRLWRRSHTSRDAAARDARSNRNDEAFDRGHVWESGVELPKNETRAVFLDHRGESKG